MIIHILEKIIDAGIGWFGLFIMALLALAGECGFQLGRLRSRVPSDLEGNTAGVSTVTAAMLGLVAFTLALTFSFAQDRFEARRHAILEEANTIGTAWLRTGLAGTAGKPIAMLVEEYARTRLAYLSAPNPDARTAALGRASTLQNTIWRQTLPLLAAMAPPLASALVSSLNDMFDASLVQRNSMESRAPTEVMLGLALGALLANGALGYQTGLAGSRQLVLMVLLLLMLSGAMMMIIDFNRPQGGFIQANPAPLVWTIQGFATSAPR